MGLLWSCIGEKKGFWMVGIWVLVISYSGMDISFVFESCIWRWWWFGFFLYVIVLEIYYVVVFFFFRIDYFYIVFICRMCSFDGMFCGFWIVYLFGMGYLFFCGGDLGWSVFVLCLFCVFVCFFCVRYWFVFMGL